MNRRIALIAAAHVAAALIRRSHTPRLHRLRGGSGRARKMGSSGQGCSECRVHRERSDQGQGEILTK
jgi:hypothetical protein